MTELSRRAWMCKGWRWMPGMVCGHRHRVDLEPGNDDLDMFGCTPDLTDPATLGCLLSLVREARGMCSAFETAVAWRCYSAGGAIWGEGKTEGEALVAALEAAP